MAFRADGLALKDQNPVKLKELDAKAQFVEKTDLDAFADQVKEGSSYAVIADCTASEFVSKFYPKWLKKGINVVTPNKKAGASDMEFYRRTKEAARLGGAQWSYETTVGAALPIITTVQ